MSAVVSALDQIRIVLVRTQGPVNLGAACRALANMGLKDLVLVAPECDPEDEQAITYAMRGKHLLRSARIVQTVPEALHDCVLTYAATGKKGSNRDQMAETGREAARRAIATTSEGRAAIAFGPEDRGLLMRELLHFDRVLEIESAPTYPVLNLAAAVMVVAYDLQTAARDADEAPSDEKRHPRANDEHKRVFHDKLFDALDRIGFFVRHPNPEQLHFALRRVFGRVDLSVNELDVLLGVASQLNWYADQAGLEFRAEPPNEPETDA